jgi:hypothetical protein
MIGKVCCLLVTMAWFAEVAQSSRQLHHLALVNYVQLPIHEQFSATANPQFNKSLRFNIYKFTVAAVDSGRIREAHIRAYRGELLLTNFRIWVDGAVTGAEVADLDNNRFPELYVYSTSDGSGSFGRVYGWQFLLERKADIKPANWHNPVAKGYMGHDSLWIERSILCRKFPVYEAGDANAQPSGGYQMMRYKLRMTGDSYSLAVE